MYGKIIVMQVISHFPEKMTLSDNRIFKITEYMYMGIYGYFSIIKYILG